MIIWGCVEESRKQGVQTRLATNTPRQRDQAPVSFGQLIIAAFHDSSSFEPDPAGPRDPATVRRNAVDRRHLQHARSWRNRLSVGAASGRVGYSPRQHADFRIVDSLGVGSPSREPERSPGIDAPPGRCTRLAPLAVSGWSDASPSELGGSAGHRGSHASLAQYQSQPATSLTVAEP